MKLVLATNNAHKLVEFKRILEPLGYEILPQKEVCGGAQVTEDGTTFSENAYKKAIAIFHLTGMPTIADDSGLCVDALNGEPGVYSARYAGEGHDDAANNNKLLSKLANVPEKERTARFVSAICCVFSDDDKVECEGYCEGKIGYELLGDNGFGYDPLFMVGEQSFAQLTGEEKDSISHRGNALKKLEKILKNRNEK